MSAFLALLKRDLRLAVRQGGALGTALGFYMLVVTLLPLGLGADLNLLSRIAPGVLWIALLLAALLSLGRVFSSDYEDGSLDILATGSLPMELVVAAKASGALDLDRHPPGVDGAGAGAAAQSRHRRLPASGRHHARRHAGGQLHRGGGGGTDVARLPGRPPDRPIGAATLRPDAVFGMAAINGLLGASGTGSAFLILTALSLASLVLCPLAAAAALRVQMQ